jgi:hypothetical protein
MEREAVVRRLTVEDASPEEDEPEAGDVGPPLQ